MPKATKKEIKITADLMARTLHNLDELGLDYAVVISGTHTIFSNVSRPVAMTVLRDELALQDKVDELRIEQMAEKLTAIPD